MLKQLKILVYGHYYPNLRISVKVLDLLKNNHTIPKTNIQNPRKWENDKNIKRIYITYLEIFFLQLAGIYIVKRNWLSKYYIYKSKSLNFQIKFQKIPEIIKYLRMFNSQYTSLFGLSFLDSNIVNQKCHLAY